MVDQLRLAAPSVRDSGPQIRHLTILPHERVTLPRGGQTPSDHFSSVTQRRYLRVPPERAQLLNDPVVPEKRMQVNASFGPINRAGAHDLATRVHRVRKGSDLRWAESAQVLGHARAPHDAAGR